ncbi:spheroidene monooxygenase [Deinococcus sp. MIMF12]|uniref:Spheroidene monooxygenase n=1 Tax=Deinococcus rhizophilus TaxID=3049544 RepID=A0ABT7JFM8_9DEIO|nr:spheroidene monooxygenase [Deinococcus rhizophilus]MDL2343855.1 spheroidene monooxygenase [Deinococcus rhizophilus]
MPSPLVTLTVNRSPPAGAWRGWQKMGTDPLHLRRVPGLTFFRLLGTGRGDDLTLGADFRRWARLAVWKDEAAFREFETSPWRGRERAHLAGSGTLLLRPLRSKGHWGGREPFGSPAAEPSTGPLAVLTRAAIRPARLRAFWSAVPASQQGLHTHPGLLLTLGMGDVPLLSQATFSVWEGAASVKAYAYAGAGHREAIARTRQEGWYSEELFARFEVLAAEGDGLGLVLPPR